MFACVSDWGRVEGGWGGFEGAGGQKHIKKHSKTQQKIAKNIATHSKIQQSIAKYIVLYRFLYVCICFLYVLYMFYSLYSFYIGFQYTPPHGDKKKYRGSRYQIFLIFLQFFHMFVYVFYRFSFLFEQSISYHRDFLLPGEGVYIPFKGIT